MLLMLVMFIPLPHNWCLASDCSPGFVAERVYWLLLRNLLGASIDCSMVAICFGGPVWYCCGSPLEKKFAELRMHCFELTALLECRCIAA